MSALAMVVLALALLNALFYLFQSNVILRALAFLWIYLAALWVSMQFFVYPFFAALETPGVWRSFKLAGLSALANPLFSTLVLVLALALTAISVAVPILALFIWPALMALLGEWALRLVLQRAGMEKIDEPEPPMRKSR